MSVLSDMGELLEKYDRWAHKPTDSGDLHLLKSIVNYLAPKMPKKAAEAKWRKMSPAKRAKMMAKAGIKKP